MLDQFNKFIVTLAGLLALLGGIYFIIQALLLSSLPMQGIYYAILGFGALWSGWHVLMKV